MNEQGHPFSFRDYRLFWLVRLCVSLAQNGLIVIIGWQTYDIARTTMGLRDASLQLGLVGLAQFAPMLLLTPVSGWVADRIDRRVLVRICIAGQACCALALSVVTLTGAVSVAALLIIAVVLGVGRAFYGPAQNAIGPNLVPLAVLPRAIPLNSIANRAGAIIGPAAAGYLYVASPPLPYLASAGLFALALTSAFFLKPLAPIEFDRSIGPMRQLLEGIRYIRGNQIVMGAILLDLFAGLLGGVGALLPVFARDILQVGASGLGHLHAAAAVGALMAALAFAHRPISQDIGAKMLGSVVVFGGAIILFGVSRWVPLSLACLAVMGAADMTSVFVRQSLIQILTPNELRGRVGAVSTLSISASNELGDAKAGMLAAVIGPVAAVVAGGIGVLVAVALCRRYFPALSTVESFETPATRST
jgi:MFS family permease